MTIGPEPQLDMAQEQRALRFVLVTLFLNAVSFGIIIPVMPPLVMQLADVDIAQATAIGGMVAVTFALFQFACSPIVGNLSDRFGRRPVLLASLFGFAVDFVILALAQSLLWIFVARALTGIFGAINGPAQSVVADITAAEDRSRRYGLISAAFGIGFVLGSALGGVLGELGVRVPFYAAAALAFANFVYGWLALPETLAPAQRRSFDWRRANPVGALMIVRRLPGIGGVAAVYLLWQIASLIYPMLWSYYAADRYGWSPGMVGASLALVGVTMATVQIFLAKRIIGKLGDRQTAMLGLGVGAVIMVGIAITDNPLVALLLILPMGLQSLVHACLTAMMTLRSSASNQGELQGFASGIMALGSIAAPLIYNPLHARFSGANPPLALDGIAFFVAAALALLALIILTRVRPSDQMPPAVTG
ncbi:MAG: TCR/Tet family MFS transporter [Sphingopyxis sp.]|nr:TCR/Tet family MFS transporter [Sphingopyxis sp.]